MTNPNLFELEGLLQLQVTESSRSKYTYSYSKFLVFLIKSNHAIVSADFRRSLGRIENLDEKLLSEKVRNALKQREFKPIYFNELHPEVFLAYLASIRKPDGSLLTSAGYGTHRASLFNLFRDYNEKIPE